MAKAKTTAVIKEQSPSDEQSAAKRIARQRKNKPENGEVTIPVSAGISVGKVFNQQSSDLWSLYHGDCCEVVVELPGNSIDYSVFSPPFASLYTYSDSERDMGNSKDYEEFFGHFRFLVEQLLRVTASGRLCSVHCMNLPTTIQHHGEIGLQDFRGDIIRAFKEAGWIYHSEVCIWKNPVTAMQRTKALGLLHKQMVKDSTRSRQGIPDYVCTFRKRGNNTKPVEGKLSRWIGDESFVSEGNLSIDLWQKYASPVWGDINASRTLQYTTARGENDERHIAPLQLDVIERCLLLWSNEEDIVLSPFAGIGSEGYCAVRMKRRFVGVELKESYWNTAVKNLQVAEAELAQVMLF